MLVVGVWLLGCGGNEPTTPSDAAPSARPAGENMPTLAQICDAHCDRANACGGGDPKECNRRCVGEGRSTSHLRGDFVWRLLSCLDQLECPFVVEGNAFSVCFEMTGRALPLTPTLRKFCFESSRRASACGRRDDADQAACRDRYRHLSDRSLEAGLDCVKEPCAQVPLCFKKRFGM